MTVLGSLIFTSCVMNTNVVVSKDAVAVTNNITVSERILKLLVWF